MTKQAIKDCVDAYTKFFKGLSKRPKFKSKRRGDFSFYQDTDKIRITAKHVKLEAIATSRRKNKQQLNWIRLAEVGRIPVGAEAFCRAFLSNSLPADLDNLKLIIESDRKKEKRQPK